MEVRNLKYTKNLIDCEINHPKYGWIPFTADPNDVEQLGREIYEKAIKGEYGDITPDLTDYELLSITEENQSQIQEAIQYLDSTDWIIVKINEAQVLGNDIQPLLEKYTVELAKRLEARDIINSLEG